MISTANHDTTGLRLGPYPRGYEVLSHGVFGGVKNRDAGRYYFFEVSTTAVTMPSNTVMNPKTYKPV